MSGTKRKLLENADGGNEVQSSLDLFEKHFCWNANDDFINRLQSQLKLTNKELIQIPAFSEYNCSANFRMSEKVFFFI